MRKFILFLATGAGAGYAPKAPGTFGSFVGLLLAFFLKDLGKWPYVTVVVTLIFTASWASTAAEVLLGEKDAQKIVIDEVAGVLVTFLFVPFGWKEALMGFFFFRVFDIWKPFPVKLCQDRLPAGWGVVGDDVVAGVYANVVLHIVTRWL